MQDAVLYHQRCKDNKDDDKRIKHGRGAHLVKIVLTEQSQEYGEADDKYCYIQDLSHNGQTKLLIVCITPLGLLLE